MYCAKYQPLIATAHFSGVWLDCLRAVLTQAGNLLAQIGTRARLPKCTEPLGVVNPLACQEALEDLCGGRRGRRRRGRVHTRGGWRWRKPDRRRALPPALINRDRAAAPGRHL